MRAALRQRGGGRIGCCAGGEAAGHSPRSERHHAPVLARVRSADVVVAVAQHQLRAAEGEDAMAFLDRDFVAACAQDRKSTRLNSSHSQISYAVFCLKK